MGEPQIVITVETEAVLSVREVWPDGDAPAQVTAEAVAEVIRRERSPKRFLDAWGLGEHMNVEVIVTAPNPHHTQGEALLPDQAPEKQITTTAEAWG